MVPGARLRAVIPVAVAGCLAAPVAQATYPGRNGRITFVSSACPSLNMFCTETIRPDGSDRRRLGDLVGASWSASGRRVLGSTSVGLALANRRGELVRTVPTPIAPDGTQLYPYQAELSPDARKIAFVHDVDLHTKPEQLVPWDRVRASEPLRGLPRHWVDASRRRADALTAG
jgi:hypothetical protein